MENVLNFLILVKDTLKWQRKTSKEYSSNGSNEKNVNPSIQLGNNFNEHIETTSPKVISSPGISSYKKSIQFNCRCMRSNLKIIVG